MQKVFNNLNPQKIIKKKYGCIEIMDNVFIGSNSTILYDVRIGPNAIVAAGSVVTWDVPPGSIVGGVPAKILKYRYTTDDIDFLLKIKWWNNPVHWFADNWEKLNDINQLKEEYNAT